MAIYLEQRIAPVPEHPAKYSEAHLRLFKDILERRGEWTDRTFILDPMGGVGKIAELQTKYGFPGHVTVNDLEREWAVQTPEGVNSVVISDAANMEWAVDGEFNVIITSPTFGNRMADHHKARDKSKRYTYTHMLGRTLHPENTGAMHWGEKYRAKHWDIWQECVRVLHKNGLFILDIKDHWNGDKLIPVSEWHKDVLEQDFNLTLLESHPLTTRHMRNGANREKRATGHNVFVFTK